MKRETKKPLEVGKQKLFRPQVYNRYKKKDKVLIVSETYRWGTVESIKIKNNKFYYTIAFSNGEASMTIPEEGFLPYIPKWQWKLLRFFNIAV
jgi:hypothetical protein